MENTQSIEYWLPVKGYENLYEISSHGRVKSLERVKHRRDRGALVLKEIILKQHRNTRGRYIVRLCRDNKKKSFLIYRLMAAAFIGEPKGERTHVNHVDGNPDNNVISNLEYLTPQENLAHFYNVIRPFRTKNSSTCLRSNSDK